MAEYIDREALLEKLANSSETWAKNIENIRNWWPHAVRIKDNIVAEIKRQPPADVEEVKHGRWKEANDGTHFCPYCGSDAPYTWDDIDRFFINSADDVPDRISNFCPNCGAKMDGGKENGKNT